MHQGIRISVKVRDEKWSPVYFPKNPQSSSPQARFRTLSPRIYIPLQLPPRRQRLEGIFGMLGATVNERRRFDAGVTKERLEAPPCSIHL